MMRELYTQLVAKQIDSQVSENVNTTQKSIKLVRDREKGVGINLKQAKKEPKVH